MATEPILATFPGECYWCGKKGYTHLHHIFFGSGKRKVSDRLGFVCYLCPDCHEGTYGVHGRDGHIVDNIIKKTCQMKYEENHTREEFIQEIGRSYL